LPDNFSVDALGASVVLISGTFLSVPFASFAAKETFSFSARAYRDIKMCI